MDFLLTQLNAFTYAEWLLIAVSFFTSLLTVVAGIGGGVFLLAVMLSVFPPLIVLPVHGVVQMGSNFFRAVLMRPYLALEVFLPFTVGAFLGAAAGSQVVVNLSDVVLKLILGLFILYLVWLPKPKKAGFLPPKLRSIVGGFLSTLASLFVGASGPLAAAFIHRSSEKKEVYVATHAASMVVQHGLKSLVFGLIGFAYMDYALLMLFMVLTGFMGTYVGKHVLLKLPEHVFAFIYRLVITLLAFKLLYESIFLLV